MTELLLILFFFTSMGFAGAVLRYLLKKSRELSTENARLQEEKNTSQNRVVELEQEALQRLNMRIRGIQP